MLRYARDFMLAVVEAKPSYKLAGDGLQQAKDYAEVLGSKFAYSTNGQGIVEFDYTDRERTGVGNVPSPKELWDRYRIAESLTDDQIADKLLTPSNTVVGKGQRYYQEIAVNRVLKALLQDPKKQLAQKRATNQEPVYIAQMDLRADLSEVWDNRETEHRSKKIFLKIVLPGGTEHDCARYLAQKGMTDSFIFPD